MEKMGDLMDEEEARTRAQWERDVASGLEATRERERRAKSAAENARLEAVEDAGVEEEEDEDEED